MQGATHRAGGVTACLVGYSYLEAVDIPIIKEAALASLLIIYPFAIWGSTASDLDHAPGSIWDEVKLTGQRSGHTLPSQDPVSRLISHTLHSTKRIRKVFPKKTLLHNVFGVCDCKHRSWQTHSEFTLVSLLIALHFVQVSSQTLSTAILSLSLIGIILGIIAHLVLDLLTPEGLPFALGLFLNRLILRKKVLPERIKIIPHVPPKKEGEPGFFSTGGTWEKKIVYNFLHAVNLILLGYFVYLYLIAPHTSFVLQ